MTKTTKISFSILLLLLCNTAILGQGNEEDKRAREQVEKYMTASQFQHNSLFDVSSTKSDFKGLFKKDNPTIIFDIPFVNESSNKSLRKQYDNSNRRTTDIIPVYGKQVTLNQYINLLEKAEKETNIDSLHFTVKFTGRVDKSKIGDGIIVFEIEKKFDSNTLTVAHVTNYLVEIDINNNNSINSIRENKQDIVYRDVLIHLKKNTKEFDKNDIISLKLNLEFPESINDISLTKKSIESKITIDHVANRGLIKIVSATDQDSVEYVIGPDWIEKGKRVSEQEYGFTLDLNPKTWNGWSYTIDLHGGMIQQAANNTPNFEEGSQFTNNPGIMFGGEFFVTKYFNPNNWRKKKKLFGVGLGFSIRYHASTINSDGFVQNNYEYVDIDNDKCEVKFKGSDYTQTTTRLDFAIPVYFDYKTKLWNNTTSLSIQPGVNVVIPFTNHYKTEGEFSRWGYYEFNEQPITDDPVYNYYTNVSKTYEGDDNFDIQLEGQLRLNLLLNIFKGSDGNINDNALVIGLIGTLPLTSSPTYNYGQGKLEDYNGYYINTENDDYHSLVHSKEKPYNFFVGLSVGINLVKYKTK